MHKYFESEEYKKFEEKYVNQQAKSILTTMFSMAVDEGDKLKDFVDLELMVQGYREAMQYAYDICLTEEELKSSVNFIMNLSNKLDAVNLIATKKLQDFIDKNQDKLMKV